jgi:pimeloyl-ACP methyl ester carboxylesterase
MKTSRRPFPSTRRRASVGWPAAVLLLACGQAWATTGVQVQLDYEGKTLNGWLTEVEQPRATILMLHGTLAHANMEIMATLAEVFAEYEVETLRITLSLGVSDRTGMFPCDALQDHRQDDALDELAAWMRWLEEKGRSDVVILGHSRGAGQVAAYAATGEGPTPMGLVLVAPAVLAPGDLAGAYERRAGTALEPLVDEARRRIEDDEPASVLSDVLFLHCEPAEVTARTFVAYYGRDDGVDALDRIRGVSMPVIVIAGSEDPLTAALGPAATALAASGAIAFVTVDGADHFFRDLYAYDAVEAVTAWLDSSASQ